MSTSHADLGRSSAPDQPGAVRLDCPRCGLTIEAKAHRLMIDHCPRCIARAANLVALIVTPPRTPRQG